MNKKNKIIERTFENGYKEGIKEGIKQELKDWIKFNQNDSSVDQDIKFITAKLKLFKELTK